MSNEEPATAAPRRWPRLLHFKFRDAATAIGGMVLGTLVGVGVQKALATTGLLGPGVDALIAEQQNKFDEVNGKLDDLRQLSSDPQVQRALGEIGTLLEQQKALTQQTEQQLKLMADEMSASKERELAERGMSGGADFWLKGGESFNLGARDQVFGLQWWNRGVVQVNLSGMTKRLNVGDVIDFAAGDRSCKVFYKQATLRGDGRVGFDLDCG